MSNALRFEKRWKTEKNGKHSNQTTKQTKKFKKEANT